MDWSAILIKKLGKLFDGERDQKIQKFIPGSLFTPLSPHFIRDLTLQMLSNRSNPFTIDRFFDSIKNMENIKNMIQSGLKDSDPVVQKNAEQADKDFKNIMTLAEAYPWTLCPWRIVLLAAEQNKFIIEGYLADEAVMDYVKNKIAAVISDPKHENFKDLVKKVATDFESQETLARAYKYNLCKNFR